MKTKKSINIELIHSFKKLTKNAMFQVRGGGDDDPPNPGGSGSDPIPPIPPPK